LYQAYRPAIGNFAARHQRFGGEFSLRRMSWIKPSFLWMMFRSGWGTKSGQEITLAVHLRRAAFDEILSHAVHSTFVPEVYRSHENWKKRLAESTVRLQWDPDHDPRGEKLERPAIQLGLSGEVLRLYAQSWIVKIEDVSAFVHNQQANAQETGYPHLLTPLEEVYPVSDPEVASRLGIGPVNSPTH
jgi:hypothetical protein